ncbi:hypothetical protein [Yokenella regensburgei]|uniref:hypothetical protein n=1 Tax=Yokenella regensburgei TaxID=158877 RepID=UPI0014331FF8|nr:hypothetical protein [Yokenella regensburgei]QIU89429.1 hypothetical protein HEC60_08940 [Yokenella regensburgei]
MTVTHNGKQYTIKKMPDGHHWQLASVDNPREKITMNRWQLHIAGILEQLERKK